jgi:hypothetical protein
MSRFVLLYIKANYTGPDGLYNHRPIPEDIKNGKRNIKVIRDCGGMQRFSGDKLYSGNQYNKCQWENIPYERYECQCKSSLCNNNPADIFLWRGVDGVIPHWQEPDPIDSNYRRR